MNAAIKIQGGIEEASGLDLSSLSISPATFHITLMVTHLKNDDDVDRLLFTFVLINLNIFTALILFLFYDFYPV